MASDKLFKMKSGFADFTEFFYGFAKFRFFFLKFCFPSNNGKPPLAKILFGIYIIAKVFNSYEWSHIISHY